MKEIQIITEGKTFDEIVDQVEYAIYVSGDLIEPTLIHQFVPSGLYVREIYMPKGVWATSFIHAEYNPFMVMTGKFTLWTEAEGKQEIEAPYRGITTPGTRRILYMHEDTAFVTVHRTDIQPKDDSPEAFDEAVKLIEDQIGVPHINKLLGGKLIKNVFTPAEDDELLLEEIYIN